jgi:hypothetical protein
MTNTVSRIISDDTLSRIIQIESAGKPTAKAPTSSATGLGQFIASTWLAVVQKHRPAWAVGKTNAQILALRTDPKCSIEMLARFTEDNASYLGAGYTDGDLYLAHFAGAGTAKKLLRASASSDCASVFSSAAIAANRSILSGKTCGQVRAWAASKMKAAGGRNWVAVYMAGAKPTVPPVVKKTAAATTVTTTAATTAAVQQGWSAGSILMAIGITFVIGGVIGAAVYFWPRKTLMKVEEGLKDGL